MNWIGAQWIETLAYNVTLSTNGRHMMLHIMLQTITLQYIITMGLHFTVFQPMGDVTQVGSPLLILDWPKWPQQQWLTIMMMMMVLMMMRRRWWQCWMIKEVPLSNHVDPNDPSNNVSWNPIQPFISCPYNSNNLIIFSLKITPIKIWFFLLSYSQCNCIKDYLNHLALYI